MTGLEKRQVGKYTVKRAGFFESMRLSDARAEADKIAAGLPEPIDPATNYALFVWPSVAACVEPPISWEEFPNIPDDEIMAVIAAVMELNNHWFSRPDPKN